MRGCGFPCSSSWAEVSGADSGRGAWPPFRRVDVPGAGEENGREREGGGSGDVRGAERAGAGGSAVRPGTCSLFGQGRVAYLQLFCGVVHGRGGLLRVRLTMCQACEPLPRHSPANFDVRALDAVWSVAKSPPAVTCSRPWHVGRPDALCEACGHAARPPLPPALSRHTLKRCRWT